MQANSVNAGQGAAWFKCGWELFKKDFGTWFIMFLVFIIIAILLNFIPFVGSLVLAIITPVLMGGWMYAANQMEQGNNIELGQLFQGFKDKPRMNKLLILGALYLAAQVVVMIIMFGLLGGTAFMAAPENGQMDPEAMQEVMFSAGSMIGMLLVFLVGFLIAMGFLYAAPLVMLDDVAPVDSIKASFAGCLKNILPLLVFGIIYFLLAIVAVIPLGLGFLILIPVSFLALYCSYRAIFH